MPKHDNYNWEKDLLGKGQYFFIFKIITKLKYLYFVYCNLFLLVKSARSQQRVGTFGTVEIKYVLWTIFFSILKP